MCRWLEYERVRIGTARHTTQRRQFITFTSSAITQKPKQAIQNKPHVSLTRSGFVCVSLCYMLSVVWCMGRCLCAGLFVFVQGLFLVFRPHPKYSPLPLQHSEQPGPHPAIDAMQAGHRCPRLSVET